MNRREHTVSIEACKKLRASSPTQTLSIEKSPPRIIEDPLCAPSCRSIGSALLDVSVWTAAIAIELTQKIDRGLVPAPCQYPLIIGY